MKKKTTIKNIKNNYKTFYCGYCDLQHIFSLEEAQFYNAGVYGWNCDIYTSGNIAITTGYRNMTGKRIPNEIIEKYENIAKEILKQPFTTPFEDKKKALEENKENFFKELNNI